MLKTYKNQLFFKEKHNGHLIAKIKEYSIFINNYYNYCNTFVAIFRQIMRIEYKAKDLDNIYLKTLVEIMNTYNPDIQQ